MFSALQTVDGFRQRFGRLSPVHAREMCQFQTVCWVIIEQNQGLKEVRKNEVRSV